MDQLYNWFDRKINEGRRSRLRVPASATDTFRRNAGGRFLFGQVKLSAVPAGEFKYISRVSWPVGEQVQVYEDCVLEGILDALFVLQSYPLLGIAVTLEEIMWHETDSCALAYRMAAQQTMKLVIGAGGSEFVA